MKLQVFALALLLALSAPAMAANTPIEGATSTTYPEDFEGYSTVPTAPTTPWATFNTAGTGTAQVVVDPTAGSTRALGVNDDATSGFTWQMENNGAGVDLCAVGFTQSLGFTFDLQSSMIAGQSIELRAVTTGATAGTQPANSFGLIVAGQTGGGEPTSVYVRGSTGGAVTPTAIGTYTAPGSVSVTFDTLICTGSTPQVRFVVSGGGLSYTGTYTTNTPFVGVVDRFEIAFIGATPITATMHLDNFAWTGAPLPAPTLASIAPARGTALGGTNFTIIGTGFKAGASVHFETPTYQATNVVVVDGSHITGTTPAHPAGLVNFVVVNPDGQSDALSGYRFDRPPAPIISALTPNNGIVQGGTLVVVSGQNFRPDFTATVDDVPAYATTYNSTTRLEIVTPPATDFTPGAVALKICNTDGQCDARLFTYREAETPEGGETETPGNGTTDTVLLETYETEPAPTCGAGTSNAFPTEEWYTISYAGLPSGCVDSTVAANGLQSMRHPTNSVAAMYDVSPLSLCGGTFSANFRLFTNAVGTLGVTSNNNAAQNINVEGPGDWNAHLDMIGGGAWRGNVNMGGVNAVVNGVNPLPANAFFPVSVSVTCALTGISATFQVNGETLSASQSGTFLGLPALSYVKVQCDTGYGSCGQANMDDFGVFLQGQSGLVGNATLTVVGLTGFDVDAFGNAGIMRHQNGASVSTFGAYGLNVVATDATNCNRVGGVMAQHSYKLNQEYVGYLHCAVGDAADVDEFRIRGTNLQPPTGTNCDGETYCVFTITDDALGSPDDGVLNLATLEAFPIDYSEIRRSGADSIHTAWAFSTDNGRVGVVGYTSNNNDQDVSISATKEISPGGAPIQMLCTARDDATGRDYLFGAEYTANVKGYQVVPTELGAPRGIKWSLEPAFTGNTQSAQPVGLACAQNSVFVHGATGTIREWNVNTASARIIAETGAAGLQSGGLAADSTRTVLAYYAAGFIHVIDLNNTAEIAILRAPTCTTLVKLEVTRGGNDVFLACNNSVTRWGLAGYTDATANYNPREDTDNDKLTNQVDTDIDGDGCPNDQEMTLIPPCDDDIDGDGIKTGADDDRDGDGLKNLGDPTPNGPTGAANNGGTNSDEPGTCTTGLLKLCLPGISGNLIAYLITLLVTGAGVLAIALTTGNGLATALVANLAWFAGFILLGVSPVPLIVGAIIAAAFGVKSFTGNGGGAP